MFGGTGQSIGRFSIGNGTSATNWAGITLDNSGNVYIVNTGASQVYEYASAGTLVRTFNLAANSNPHSVAILPNGDLLVDAPGVGAIEKFDSRGNALGVFATSGSATGIAVDGSGLAYSWNGTLTKLTDGGQSLGTLGSGILGGTGSAASGIADDPSGNLFVTDDGLGKIFKLGASGVLLDTLPSRGGTHFRAIAVGPGGILYVPDENNDRVDIYGP